MRNVLVGPSTYIHVMAYGGMPRMSEYTLLLDYGNFQKNLGYAEAMDVPSWDVHLEIQSDRSDIDRARTQVANKFLQAGKWEILFTLDRDHTWRPVTDAYEGDILHTCKQAAKTKSIVGAMIAKKNGRKEPAFMPRKEAAVRLGTEGLVECYNMGFAFTATHISVFERMAKTMEKTTEGDYPFFCPMVTHLDWPQADRKGNYYLSEDTAFIERCRKEGIVTYASSMPIVGHIGDYEYALFDRKKI